MSRICLISVTIVQISAQAQFSGGIGASGSVFGNVQKSAQGIVAGSLSVKVHKKLESVHMSRVSICEGMKKWCTVSGESVQYSVQWCVLVCREMFKKLGKCICQGYSRARKFLGECTVSVSIVRVSAQSV